MSDNTSAIAENVTDIATNTSAIAGLGTFSGTAEKTVVTNSSGNLVTLDSVSKGHLEYLQNVDADLQDSLNNRLKLDTTQSLTSGTLKLSSNSNQQLILQHTGYADLKLFSNFGQAGIDWKAGVATIIFDGGRISTNGVMLRPPMLTSDPTDPANTCQGCLYVNTSSPGAFELRFHDGTSWGTIS